jgi:hypothetical protein
MCGVPMAEPRIFRQCRLANGAEMRIVSAE